MLACGDRPQSDLWACQHTGGEETERRSVCDLERGGDDLHEFSIIILESKDKSGLKILDLFN